MGVEGEGSKWRKWRERRKRRRWERVWRVWRERKKEGGGRVCGGNGEKDRKEVGEDVEGNGRR